MENSFIRLNRKFFKNAYWEQERTFSLSEAWLDMIQMARYEEKTLIKILSNNRQININRGEMHASLRYLSKRWKWSVEKTQKFIAKHIELKEIERRIERGETILKLCNYDHYNPIHNIEPSTSQTAEYTNNKKVKNIKQEECIKEKPQRFVPPAQEEISAYCLERKNTVDPERFFNFYTSKGWMIGRNKMKDWRAAIRVWEKNDPKPIYAHPAINYESQKLKYDERW